MADNPYQEFKNWLCDGNLNSELNKEVEKAIFILAALVMFSRLKETTVFLNDMFNNESIYDKNLYTKKIEFFNELKEIATKLKLSPWDLSYISLKKEKFEYKELQERFPNLKKYEIELLIDIMKKEKNKSFLEIIKKTENKKKKLSKSDEKLFK